MDWYGIVDFAEKEPTLLSTKENRRLEEVVESLETSLTVDRSELSSRRGVSCVGLLDRRTVEYQKLENQSGHFLKELGSNIL